MALGESSQGGKIALPLFREKGYQKRKRERKKEIEMVAPISVVKGPRSRLIERGRERAWDRQSFLGEKHKGGKKGVKKKRILPPYTKKPYSFAERRRTERQKRIKAREEQGGGGVLKKLNQKGKGRISSNTPPDV